MTPDPNLILAGLVGLIVLFGLYVLFHKKERLSAKTQRHVSKLWSEVASLADEHPEQAVLKADKLLDYALTQAGFSGTLGEKLKKARAVFSDNDAVWSAHKLRNRVAHEINVQLKPRQVQSALKGFKRAFKDLGISL